MKLLTVLASSTLVLAGAGTALASCASGASSQVKMYNCSTASVRPSEVVITCADAGIYVNHLKWTNWGDTTASATGTFHENLCKPSCADGKYETKAIAVRATKIVTVKGVRLYSELVWPHGSWGDQGPVWQLPTKPE